MFLVVSPLSVFNLVLSTHFFACPIGRASKIEKKATGIPELTLSGTG